MNLKNNFTFIDEKELSKKSEINKNHFIELINGDSELLELIKLNLKIENNMSKINDFKIINLIFDKNSLNLVFDADKESLSIIKEHFLMTIAGSQKDADENFNKYKINRFYLLPIDFEIKMRSLEEYQDYLLSTLKRIIKEQVIFDFYKTDWKADGTIYSAFLIYKEKIEPMDEKSRDDIVNKIKSIY